MNQFAVMDIEYRHFTNATLITIATNTPCHLTCYWTAVQPQKHHASRTIRGLLVPWGAYFCFVAWTAVEQIEPGDTLTHTFAIKDWLKDTLRWFTFRGEVATVLSPSISAIFRHMHPGQDIILNPTFVEWPPAQAIPTHWTKIDAKHTELDPVPDYTIFKVDGVSPRSFINLSGQAVGLRQYLNITGLTGLTVTLSAQCRGLNQTSNGIGIGVWNARYHFYSKQLSLYYQWELLDKTIVLPDTLSQMYVQSLTRYTIPMIDIWGWIDDWQINLV